MKIALVTAVAARGTDPDEQPVIDALAGAGFEVDVQPWDDQTVRWSDYDLAIIRSTYDYMDHLEKFFAWLGAVSAMTTLANPFAAVKWSLDKHYFQELTAAGVPVVPSLFVEPGQSSDTALGAFDRFVVKPCVGCGSRGVSSYDVIGHPEHKDAARSHMRALLDEGLSVMVQPMISSVPTRGELPMVFFGGTFSHGASKRVSIPSGGELITGLFAPEDNRPIQPTQREIEVATQAMNAVPESVGKLLYGRVDLVWGDDGEPLVLEVELAEPSLFFAQSPLSVANLVAAVRAMLARH
jgi:glutathione synthase/RimK-type ligase-like ATP-grasp enzyme